MSTTKQTSVKNVGVTAFRDNIKGFLEVAENEILIVNSKGKRYLVAPIKDAEENLNKEVSRLNSQINK
ncbi:hypothetical protein [uncultured Flavobacterium sp.]|jgi:hypothetical protein|uniref:hypothetical protein n=1 Tax=uncultured Flavobacterium sp. TaxID=165435 RepID=UPI00259A909B|nr:hypothetical protein [uncultured Flavobacterium sp.]